MNEAVIAGIHAVVLDRLSRLHSEDGLTAADERQRVRSWIGQELVSEATRRSDAGVPQLTAAEEAIVLRRVENAIWGLGMLQEILDNPDIEDVYITGCDPPLVRFRDGVIRRAKDGLAESDAALIEQIQFIAGHHATSERAFSPSQPFLNMRLPDGSRLAAIRDVARRPTVTIRRHRVAHLTLSDLAGMGTLSAQIGEFICAVVRARGNIAFTGAPGVGKTTLMRCAAREIPATERIATLETEFELGLADLANASPLLIALEARPGSTEADPKTGHRAGEITLSDLVHQVLRMSVTRVVVGEVRGAEALPMLEAMTAGMPGSMCTLHAGSAGEAFERLVTAAMKGAGHGWSDAFVTRLAAQGIDYVVHMRQVDHPALGGQRRIVSEVAEVAGVTETGVVALNRIFAPDPSGTDPRAVFRMLPQNRAPFEEAGIDLAALLLPANGQVRVR
ncbi:CpaF family protein [Pseudonocardia oroxyli]|uniref:Pilus assembly protein, ATPase of CpaF family n=1 Tax=Pseudonocardia oroxyli TaxID=366584 RepID=A0A1G7WZ53_PSEOR|nr:ATPase, T2SS/T4P/T4SS family [Pseudonocardia oroxyli]SDG77195.1 Pilus assembly protein, ATPase of CpaF family [Pseudonocardia oroxyli]